MEIATDTSSYTYTEVIQLLVSDWILKVDGAFYIRNQHAQALISFNNNKVSGHFIIFQQPQK